MRVADLATVRLFQLVSPLLPVGAYSYSQGLEAAVEAGLVRDEQTAGYWIEAVLDAGFSRFELPVLKRLHDAWRAHDSALAAEWNNRYLVSRESAEFHAETLQMGYSLRELARQLSAENTTPAALSAIEPVTYPTVLAWLAVHWAVPHDGLLLGHSWSWLENQVSAALKAVPLGQAAGQRILLHLGGRLPEQVQAACVLTDNELSNFAPGLAILSCRHETQYSRLFRS